MRPSKEVPVYLHVEKVDFRKSIAGLSVIVEQGMVKNFLTMLYLYLRIKLAIESKYYTLRTYLS